MHKIMKNYVAILFTSTILICCGEKTDKSLNESYSTALELIKDSEPTNINEVYNEMKLIDVRLETEGKEPLNVEQKAIIEATLRRKMAELQRNKPAVR